MRSAIATSLSLLVIAGCASFGRSADTLGIRGHELAAQEHERSAVEHRKAALKYGGAICATSSSFCPTGSVSPGTTVEFEQATTDDHLAQEHRARIEELRDNMQRACAGIPEGDGKANSFGRVDTIRRIEKDGGRLQGVVVIAANERPLDEVERVIRCRVARSAARGLDGMEPGACPFVPGAAATVRAEGRNIAITITAPDETVSKALDHCAPALPKSDALPSTKSFRGLLPPSGRDPFRAWLKSRKENGSEGSKV